MRSRSGERIEIELVEIGDVFDQFLFEQLNDDLFAEAVDIHRVAAGKMQQRFAAARRARDIDAAIGDLLFVLVDARAANRALLRHFEFDFFRAVLHDAEDVRDDFACAFDEHRVARVDVEAADFVEIVERRFGNGDAADVDRLEDCERRENARAADADENLPYERGFLARGIFISDRPARGFRRVAQLVLERDFVDFHDDAVDFIRQLFALRFPGVDIFFDFAHAVAELPIFARPEMNVFQNAEHFRKALSGRAVHRRAGNTRKNRDGATR